MKHFPASQLIINADGSIFHLHLHPEQLADRVILVGDPGRVKNVASFFDKQECSVSNREFNTVTGTYNGKRISVISTGIGTDNCDIVMNELDALTNINLGTREPKPEPKSLTIVRIGTSGGLQPECGLGSFVVSEKSLGFDGLLTFYADWEKFCDLEFSKEFIRQTNFSPMHAFPYVVNADAGLVTQIAQHDMIRGVTIAGNGFYGPQGRELRLGLNDPELNGKIEKFSFNNHKITNFEMESSAIAGLSKMMGHRATTVCCIIANRLAEEANVDYGKQIDKLIKTVLDRI
ncbi:MAG: nucleoside phosphorylase [Prevotellaceae bacterium]|jgi:uridine phosphorylase|nr:nucleoside phosphorylase [Prevotellaceae bacterium]